MTLFVFKSTEITPRRSQRRIQKARDASPPPEEQMSTRGPRSMAKFNKSLRDLNKTATGVDNEIPKVKLSRPSLPAQGNTDQIEKEQLVS